MNIVLYLSCFCLLTVPHAGDNVPRIRRMGGRLRMPLDGHQWNIKGTPCLLHVAFWIRCWSGISYRGVRFGATHTDVVCRRCNQRQ